MVQKSPPSYNRHHSGYFYYSVYDADGDVVRCRWADGESGDVTQPSTDVLNLDEVGWLDEKLDEK